jgi:pimeloyl-ACP methyl ester carboxylesterase
LSEAPTPEQRGKLLGLLSVLGDERPSMLERLRRTPTRVNAQGLLGPLIRLKEIRTLGVGKLDLTSVPAGRLDALARYAYSVRAQTISRMREDRKIATLVAAARELEIRATEPPLTGASFQEDHAAKALTPANPIAIEHETFGEPTAPPILLIMGLGGQLIHWDEAFCRLLAGLRRYVIRFDNRDVELSTKLDELPAPETRQSVRARLEGRSPAAPYTLDDMADDAVRLLDWLGIARAHVVGTSMGGMIAQCMAIRHPTRLLSLASIMADAGEPAVPRPEAMIAFEPPATECETYVTQILNILRALCGPRFVLEEQGARQVALNAFNQGNLISTQPIGCWASFVGPTYAIGLSYS